MAPKVDIEQDGEVCAQGFLLFEALRIFPSMETISGVLTLPEGKDYAGTGDGLRL